jgi:hypothetical protein
MFKAAFGIKTEQPPEEFTSRKPRRHFCSLPGLPIPDYWRVENCLDSCELAQEVLRREQLVSVENRDVKSGSRATCDRTANERQ